MKRKNLIGSVITLIGLAALCAVLANVPGVVHAQSATGRPVVLASAEGAGILFADTERIADGDGLPVDTVTFTTFNWTYQWIRVDGNSQTNVGANSASYQPVEADVGKLIKVKVSFTDGASNSEARTSLPFGPITELTRPSAPPSKLVSNTGQSASATANITKRYAQGFRLGDHGQGYEISSVSIELAAVPSSLTVSIWSGGVQGALQPNIATKLFDFANPSSFAVGLNKFTAPAGAFAYQNVNYFIVLSGFGATLSIKETSSDNEDSGGETGAVIYDKAAVRALSDTGYWKISTSRAGVLRLAVEGSKRATGILASNYAQPRIDDKGTADTEDDTGPHQEIISLGDDIGFGFELGAADRYLIRGVSLNSDDSTPGRSGFTNPFVLRSGSRTGTQQFSLVNTRKAPGLPVWTAPQGATVTGGTGGQAYVFDQPIGADNGAENERRRDAVLFRVAGAGSDGVDSPAAAGVSLTGAKGDVALNDPYMAVLGEPLDAMVQNLGQTNNGYRSVDGTNKVLSQEFTTGSNATYGYRLQGIGVNIEGSSSNFPDGPTSVSVAVHASLSGRPRAKLFDLVSPTEYAAGHSFFEAPPGTFLAPNTSYVLVWSHLGGASHRLRKTGSNGEDFGAHTGASIANAFYRGADLSIQSLSEDSGGNALEIAVYTEVNTETVVYITEPPPPPPPPPFVPGVSGDAILRCSVPPADYCPTYDDLPTEITLWSATLTVGERATGTTVQRAGFNRGGNEPEIGTISDDSFDLTGVPHVVTRIQITLPTIINQLHLVLDTPIGEEADQLILHLDSVSLPLRNATVSAEGFAFVWDNHGLTWSDNESIEVKISRPRTPNAYGYRTIWTGLMTAGTINTKVGYTSLSGSMSNNLIVKGRDETITIGTEDQPRFPWTGYRITEFLDEGTTLEIDFSPDSYPSIEEVSNWRLDLGGGIVLPFPSEPVHIGTPWIWQFNHDPGWSAGDQVLVSIRNDEVQNRIGRVNFRSRRSTSLDSNGNIVYGKTHFIYDRSNGGKFGPRDRWELQHLQVTTDKTGDTDPVWITATFRTPDADTGYQGWWEGQFDDFHTLFLRWIYHEGGIGKGEATYTLPLRTAAAEGGISYRAKYDGRPDNLFVSEGRDVTFTWVRTYKEFQRRHLDLANHSDFSAHMLAPPKPATARAGGEGGDGDNLQRVYVPTTVTSVDFTSNPGSDQVYGPWSTIQVTVTFSEDVTVGYVGSKRDAAELDLEMDGQTRTAHYASTEGNRVKFEYTVLAGDEATFALRLRPNSLRLSRDKPSEHGSIRDSEGRDAVLDHNGLADTGHRVDAVSPDFASALVSTDGAQVAVTFDESIKSPAILRWFGVQTSLLQSLTLDVWVDGELAARSDAALSGDTVTLTMAEPITQGQTVAVSYDNLFVQTGESILQDLRSIKLLPFTEQPVTNGSALADVERPDGGLALSRTDLEIDEGESGTYTVALASQPASDVTVEISQRPPGRATVSPASLTFTADNWNTPQTVTITSAEDANNVDRWLLLRHVATGDNYGGSAVAWLILRDGYNLVTATPNTGATGSPTISGTPQVDHTLTVDLSNIADADGLTHASYTWLYQWLRGGSEIRGATEPTYTLVDADARKTIKVKVSFTDDANNQESRTSARTMPIELPPNILPTGLPTINGTPQVRRPLTVDTSEIADADGMEESVFLYEWLAKNSEVTRELAGEHSPTYTPSPAEEGFAIMVRVTFTDDRGHDESLTSAATTAVIAADFNTEPTGLPTISGTPQVGETLTADTSAIDDVDGLTNVSYRYQWLGDQSVLDANTGTYYYINVDLPGETGSTYTLAPADRGRTFAVKVSFTDDAGYAESLTSRNTVVVAAKPNSEPTGLPAISGTPQVGQTLTADTSAIDDADGLTNVSYEYWWTASKTVVDENTGTSFPIISALSGDMSPTYTLVPADAGYTFKVRVTFTDDAGNNESLTSVATEAVAATAPTAPQSLSVATGDQDQELEASWQAPSSNGGSAVTGYKVQWKEAADSWNTATGVSEATETGTTHTITSLTGGVEYAVRVIATNDVGDGPASTEAKGTPAGGVSEQTVEPENTAPTGLPSISGNPQVDQTLTADTTPIDDEDGLTNVSYRYQWIAGGSDIDGATGSSYLLTSSEQGQTIQVRVTFTDDAGNAESLTSAATVEVTAVPVPLTASFLAAPSSHDGDNSFTFELRLSEEVDLSYVTLRDQNAFSLTAGEVTGASRLDKPGNLRWEIVVEPDSGADVTIVLPPTTDCGAQGAICTADGRKLPGRVELTVNGPEQQSQEQQNNSATGAPAISGTPQVGETLTASTSGIADQDGLTGVSYRYQWIAGGSDISGATGSSHTLTSSEEGQTIQVRVDFTDDAGNAESLTSVATDAVAPKPVPLTASFANVPTAHDGSAFTFDLSFSEEVELSYVTLRDDDAFSVTDGGVTSARRLTQGSNIGWTITVTPGSAAGVTVVLPVTTDCDADGAVCTQGGKKLSNRLEFTVSGPGQ